MAAEDYPEPADAMDDVRRRRRGQGICRVNELTGNASMIENKPGMFRFPYFAVGFVVGVCGAVLGIFLGKIL